MKKDLINLIITVWMGVMIYLMYEMYIDLNYMTDLFHAYVKMAVEIARQ
jgi:hypothetical protein